MPTFSLVLELLGLEFLGLAFVYVSLPQSMVVPPLFDQLVVLELAVAKEFEVGACCCC
jgi:hypothetical protein